MDEKRRIAALILATGAFATVQGCATDDAVEKDVKNAAPEVKKVGKEVEDEAKEAGRAVDKEIKD